MTNHLEAFGVTLAPSDMYVGNVRRLSTSVELINLFGAKGAWDPGWYLIGSPATAMRRPLAGPFDSGVEAEKAHLLSERSFFARQLNLSGPTANTHGKFGFMAFRASIFEPTIILKPENLVMHEGSRVDGFTKFECGEGLYIGKNVHIASFCHIGIGGGTVIFEEGSSAGSGTRVMSGSARADAPSCSATSPEAVNEKTTTIIRKNATLFVNVVVAPGCDIGEGARIYPGAVLPKGTFVPAGEHWGGVPARRLK